MPAPATYVETDCTVSFQGRTFESGGAVVTPDYAIVYIAGDRPGIVTDWHGRELGRYRVTSSWPVDSWQNTRMYAYRITIGDANYYGRGFGQGFYVKARRVKAERGV